MIKPQLQGTPNYAKGIYQTYNRPLAIREAYSHVPILGVILGVKIV